MYFILIKFRPQYVRKSAMKFFRSEMTPIIFGVSPKIHLYWREEASLIHQIYLLTLNADNWITSDKTEEEILNFFNEICLVINIFLQICLLYHQKLKRWPSPKARVQRHFQAADQLFPGLGATCTDFLFNLGPGIINRCLLFIWASLQLTERT